MKFCSGHTPKQSLSSTSINNLVFLVCACLKQAQIKRLIIIFTFTAFSVRPGLFPRLKITSFLKKHQFEQLFEMYTSNCEAKSYHLKLCASHNTQ